MIYSIQILRGLAAVMVMLFHYSHYLKSTVPGADIGYVLFSGGYAGVDVFFIISGFIIVHSTERREHARPADFCIRRFFRVVPLAQLVTVVYFFALSARPTTRVLWRSLLFLPQADADPPKFGYPVVPQEWTLSYELFFYLIFAVILAFTHRRRVLAAVLAIIGCVVGFQAMLGGSFTLYPNRVALPTVAGGIIPPEILGELGNPILLEFAFGMVLSLAYRRWEAWLRVGHRARAERLVGALLVGAFVWSYFSRVDTGNGLLSKGGGAACLVVGALLFEVSWRRPTAPDLRRWGLSSLLGLGTISYALYLVHLGISEKLLRRTCGLLLGLHVDGVWGFLGLVVTSLLVATALHLGAERPCIRAGKLVIQWKDRRSG